MGSWYVAYDDDGSICRCYASSDDEEENDDPSEWCNYCQTHFETRREAVTHKSTVHHYCPTCDRLFQTYNGMRNHLETASVHVNGARAAPVSSSVVIPGFTTFVVSKLPPPEYTCSPCDHSFNILHQLERHRLTYHRDERAMLPQNAEAEECPAPPTLYQSTEMAHKEKEKYGCYFCPGLVFASITQLNQHLESSNHDQKSMYTCPSCQVKTQTLSGFIQHAEIGSCGLRRDSRVQRALQGLSGGMKQMGR